MGLKEKCHTLAAEAICQYLLTGDVPRRNIITKHTLMIHGRIAALLTQMLKKGALTKRPRPKNP